MGLHAVSNSEPASEDDDTHYPCLAYHCAAFIPVADLAEQAGLEGFDLCAGIAQTGHRDESSLAEPNHRPDRQVVEFETLRRNVLAKIAR